jgi:hypothetical protein
MEARSRTKDGACSPAHSSDGTTPARSRSRRRTISGCDTGGAPSRAESDGAAPARPRASFRSVGVAHPLVALIGKNIGGLQGRVGRLVSEHDGHRG